MTRGAAFTVEVLPPQSFSRDWIESLATLCSILIEQAVQLASPAT
jgi:hypothetical protein